MISRLAHYAVPVLQKTALTRNPGTQREGGEFKLHPDFVKAIHSTPENYSLWQNYVMDPFQDLYPKINPLSWLMRKVDSAETPKPDPNIHIIEMYRRGMDDVVTPFKSEVEYQTAFDEFRKSKTLQGGGTPPSTQEILNEFHGQCLKQLPVYKKATIIERIHPDGQKTITNTAVRRTVVDNHAPSVVGRDVEEERLVDNVYRQGIRNMTHDFPEILHSLNTHERLDAILKHDAKMPPAVTPYVVYTPPRVDGITSEPEVIL